MSNGRLVIAAVVGFLILAVVFGAMWFWIGTAPVSGAQKTSAHIEVFKTTASVAVMLGGIGALYLAARRQRTQEFQHSHAVDVAADAKEDARQRRITELYTKAVEQLDSDKAPVRLGGLYALDRLAQSDETQRQTVVNVICGYLRMPFTPPPRPKPTTLDTDVHRTPSVRPGPPSSADGDAQHQELNVRLAAQQLLLEHLILTPGDDTKHWANIDLDLTGATLIDFSLAGCSLRDATFTDATFIGEADFTGAIFAGRTKFIRAQFTSRAIFEQAQFHRDSQLFKAWFIGHASFEKSRFVLEARFDGARFDRPARFNDAQLGAAWFGAVAFFADVDFQDTTFAEGPVDFGGAARLLNAVARMEDGGSSIWPSGWAPDTAAEPISLPDFPGIWRTLRYTPLHEPPSTGN
ncbi:pentapeptide repeat-containing protein [Lentzea sp. NPDC058436]|uniref:pentapeptide repeat-containing protein n=1 Tax=Lentzea sp. NPDC058436 TaxID=3346499 RepID=UPI003666198D